MKFTRQIAHRLPFILLLSLVSSVCAEGSVRHIYSVTSDDTLSVLDVNACFEGNPPAKLVAESLDAVVASKGVWNVQTGEEITPSGFIPMDGIASGGCVRFVVDISVFALDVVREGGLQLLRIISLDQMA